MRLIGTALGGAAAGAILWLILNGLTSGSAASRRFETWGAAGEQCHWLASAVGVVIAMITSNSGQKPWNCGFQPGYLSGRPPSSALPTRR